MAAATTVARNARRARPPAPRATRHATPPPGLLVAVFAAGPGAGASTLARLLALAAAGRENFRVLLCRQPGPATRAWAELPPGQRLGELSVRTWVAGDSRRRVARVRVLAVPARPDGRELARFALRLARARTHHALTVVDCSTLAGPAERVALAHASHHVLVLAATVDGIAQARGALARVRAPANARRVLVARRDRERDPDLAALRGLAADQRAPLVLAPWLAPWRSDESALEHAGISLQALCGALTR